MKTKRFFLQALKGIGVFLCLAVLAVEQTFSCLGDGATDAEVLSRSAYFLALNYGAWILNRRYLLPRLAENGRYLQYLLLLYGVVVSVIALGFLMDCHALKVFTSSVLLYICFLALSTRSFLRIWERNVQAQAEAQQRLLDSRVNERRLRVDAAMLDRELATAQSEATVAPENAINRLYNLSRDLRAQLYQE
ncbi:MAG: hypothetical protein LUC85_01585 [Bacteroidales bacterium]|nr:hypothetical protein [Bacteroidales bacterium]MCD8393511.1 hypothetical protein [Bacteroidales bacterium]